MITLAKWSIADYHKMIAAGILRDRNIRLIDGELIEMSPEGVINVAIRRQYRRLFTSNSHRKSLD